ncbi:hypothetical protein MATL_G00223760 [Megalops atlanticus]|uniref:Uncharacterized protein n=1 Tax=Megalops atlanticus TaxID=7932 RepID=A0A9D3SWF4_MEGAT|nr:hypothetical protein MATL_G00223760 [Megalops atlanticus]
MPFMFPELGPKKLQKDIQTAAEHHQMDFRHGPILSCQSLLSPFLDHQNKSMDTNFPATAHTARTVPPFALFWGTVIQNILIVLSRCGIFEVDQFLFLDV